MAVIEGERVAAGARRQPDHTGEFLAVGAGLAAVVAFALWQNSKGGGTTPPVSCDVCQDTCAGPCAGPHLATGLYQTLDGVTYWVNGCRRWGVPSSIQQQRCFAGVTPIVKGDNYFGNADVSNPYDWVMTVGDVTACSVCPPGSPGAAG